MLEIITRIHIPKMDKTDQGQSAAGKNAPVQNV
jgi:hypothetical protein